VHGYTVSALLACAAVLGLELAVLRTGLLRRHTYWIAYGIILFFQVIVDGWLTKLTAPIVLYARQHFSGVRFPWDIPVEDYLFGWAMCTLALLLWERQSDPSDQRPEPQPVFDLLRQGSSSLPE
jgi:lycopene cyclase domain-containing protein